MDWKDKEQVRAYKRNYWHEHKEENRAKRRRWYKKNAETRVRHHRLKSRYGLTLDDYNKLLKLQNGSCAICHDQIGDGLYVDHDHETKQVRGLLCKNCNVGLGWFRDDPSLLIDAASYLLNQE